MNTEEPETEPGEHVVVGDLADLIEGQGAVDICGCGYEITEYEGGWLHIINPALAGTDDHDAHP
ncbi:hypothetical protein [Nonomuraea endophytica]|uniref:hypothetical protein n=1 Tax=Nonomuraea endophytica TaxID=714136 RepID=UPI0037C6C2FA